MESTAEWYSRFAENEARDRSPRYEEWARGIAGDSDILTLIDELQPSKRQPNLVFASARWLGCPIVPFEEWRDWLAVHWAEVRATASARFTQTNEVGRCAALLPALAAIEGPIALLEVGASAGLCLYPDRYSYRFGDREPLHPHAGESSVMLECEVNDRVPVPQAMPDIAWRAGIDLNPLDVRKEDDASWLDALIWPDNEARRERLSAAIALVADDPPRIIRADATEALTALAAEAPRNATLVVVTAGTLVYLTRADREAFLTQLRTTDAAWLALESARLFDSVATDLTTGRGIDPLALNSHFALSLDGRALALAGPHGQFLDWL